MGGARGPVGSGGVGDEGGIRVDAIGRQGGFVRFDQDERGPPPRLVQVPPRAETELSVKPLRVGRCGLPEPDVVGTAAELAVRGAVLVVEWAGTAQLPG